MATSPDPGIEGLRRYARVSIPMRLIGVVVLCVSPFTDPALFMTPVVLVSAAILGLSDVLVYASRRFSDRHVRRTMVYSVALDYLSMTVLLLGILDPTAPMAYTGTIVIGLEAALLFRRQGAAAFTGAVLAVGWVPFARWVWAGVDIELMPFLLQTAGTIFASWITAALSEESERRRQAAAYIAGLNEVLALVAQQIMSTPRRDQVVDTLRAVLERVELPWLFSVLSRQPDGTLMGPQATVVDAETVRQSWDGAASVVCNPGFLSADFGEHGSVLIRCPTADGLAAAIVVTAPAGGAFGDREIEFFATLGHQASVALDRAALHEHVAELALTDMLTQLHNRRAFDERLAEEIVRSDRDHQPLALVMLDIDHFKLLNDTQGHPAGDRTLQKIGEILKSPALLRPIDLSYRLGGEEFVVLLPGTSLEGAMVVAEKLRSLVGETDFADAAEQPLGHLTVSVGVAVHIPGSGDSGTALIEASDLALYEAKRSGRDCVRHVPGASAPARSVAG